MSFADYFHRVHATLSEQYGDVSEITCPQEFNRFEEDPIGAMKYAFQEGIVTKLEDSYVWKYNLKAGFPLFTRAVELMHEAYVDWSNEQYGQR